MSNSRLAPLNSKMIEELTQAEAKAQSLLAKWVFDPKNRSFFQALFASKPPMELVTQLNDEKISPNTTLEKIQNLISNQSAIPKLFDLPAEQWLQIIIQENILLEDMFLLIGRYGIFYNLFNEINSLPSAELKAKVLNVLNRAQYISSAEVNQLFNTLPLTKDKIELFKNIFEFAFQMLKEPTLDLDGNPCTPQIDSFLGSDAKQQSRSNGALRVIKECVKDSYKNVILKLIAEGQAKATSNLAKFVFNPDNLEKISCVLTIKSPQELVKDLNKINISQATLEQLNVITSNQHEYLSLFKLPVEKWFKILIEENIQTEDLLALIGSGEVLEGAASGMINEINLLKNPKDRAWAFYYLNNSKKDNKEDILAFLSTLHLPEDKEVAKAFQDSFISLHKIVNNTIVETKHFDGTVLKSKAMEDLIRLKKFELSPEELVTLETIKDKKRKLMAENSSISDSKQHKNLELTTDEALMIDTIEKRRKDLTQYNENRTKAVLRIMHECIEDNYEKACLEINKEELNKFLEELNLFCIKQREKDKQKIDEEKAREIDLELNGQHNTRLMGHLPGQFSQIIFLPNSFDPQNLDSFRNILREMNDTHSHGLRLAIRTINLTEDSDPESDDEDLDAEHKQESKQPNTPVHSNQSSSSIIMRTITHGTAPMIRETKINLPRYVEDDDDMMLSEAIQRSLESSNPHQLPPSSGSEINKTPRR